MHFPERFEAESIGVISINNKAFKNSGIVSNFAESIKSRDGGHEGNEWNGEMHYHAIDKDNIVAMDKIDKIAGYSAMMKTPFLDAKTRSTIVNVPEQDGSGDVTHFMDKVMNQLLNLTVRKLREILTKYVSITIVGMTALIPEFIYYIKFAEYIEKMMKQGFHKSHPDQKGSDNLQYTYA